MKGKGWGRRSGGCSGHQSVLCSILIDIEVVYYFNGPLYTLSASMDVRGECRKLQRGLAVVIAK